MLNYIRLISLILFLAGANSLVFGQCTSGSLIPAGTLNNPFIPQCNQPKIIYTTQVGTGPTATFNTTGTTTNQYSNVSVVAGYQYNFRSLDASGVYPADIITIATDAATPAVLFSGLNGSSGIYWTATFTGVIRFYTHQAGCGTAGLQPARQRHVIMAPFQASISTVNSCTSSPTGQYTVTVGPNHGWNSTSNVGTGLNAYNTNTATVVGSISPLSYAILTNTGTNVNSGTGGSSNTNAEICPLCPPVVNLNTIVNGTSTWSGTSTLTLPFTSYIYYTSLSPISGPTNPFTTTNIGPVGTYTSPANIVGNNASNQSIGVKPSGTNSQLSLYNAGCGAYMFYPTIGSIAPVLPTFAPVAAICSGATAPVLPTSSTNTTPITGTWSPAVSNTATTTYTFTPAVGQCATSTSMTITVTPNVTPAVSIAVSPSGPICAGTSVTFTATPTNGGTTPTYQWQLGGVDIIGATSATYTSAGLANGNTITVVMTTYNTCQTGSPATSNPITMTVTPNAIPSVSIAASATTICVGTSVTFTATPTNGGPTPTYQWTLNGANVGTGSTTYTNSSLANGDVVAVVMNSNNTCQTGSSATSTPTVVAVNALPTPSIITTTPTTLCSGGSVDLTASGGTSYSWINGSTPVGTGSTYIATTAGSYTVIATDANGCVSAASSATVVSVNPLPTAIITTTTSTTFCSGGSVDLTASGGTSYTWSNGSTTVGTGSTYTATTAGSYTVIATDVNGCVSAASSATVVSVNPLPTAIITPATSTTFCSGGNVVLTASGGTSYSWSNGSTPVGTGSTYTATTAGSYTVIATDANGCVSAASGSAVVTVNPLPTASISAGGTTTFCQGGSVDLTASGGTSYSWSNGSTSVGTSASTYTATTAGSYTVIATDANGCVSAASGSEVVTVIALPTASITTTTPTTFCQGGSVDLTASGGTSYSWSNGSTPVGTSASTYTASTAGSYTVIATDANGCVSAASTAMPVTVIALPTATITTTTPTTFCSGGSVDLTASGGTSYSWSNGSTSVGTGSTYTATTAGSYTVIATDANGCVSAASSATAVTVNALPTAIINTTTPTTFCSGGSVDLTASGGTSYSWSNGSTPVGTSASTYTATTAGSYTVIATDANGCVSAASGSEVVTVIALPVLPIVDTTAATCLLDGTATLSNYDNTLIYTFNPSSPIGPTVDITTGVISNMTAGSPYTITSNNGLCSIDSSPFTIDIQLITPPAPIIAISAPTCSSDGIATITNYITGQNYIFTPIGPTVGAVGVISGMNAGINYTVTSNNGPCASPSSSLIVDPLLGIFNVIVDTTICSSNLPFSMNSLTFSAAGTQVANLTAANGCDSLVTINLTVIANANSNFSQILPICYGDPLALPISSLNGFSGTWSPAINNTDTTTYTFTPGIGQCGYTTTMTIIVNPQPIVTITDTSICTGGTAILVATASPAGGTYFWSNANPTSSITVSPTFSTTYSVFYTSLNNCPATASRLLAVNPIPTVTATSALICDGEIATIVATGLPTGGTYLWSPGAETSAGINISPNITSNYSVVYSRLGCASPQVNSTVTVKPVPIITLASAVICIGAAVTMTAQTTIAGGVYDWGNGNANETQTFSPLSDTTLSLSYSLNGCTSPIETATITVNPLPISTFSGSPLTGCIPLEVTLLADDNTNTSYSWSASNGLTGTGAQSSLTFTSGGVYDITLTAGLNGCSTTTTLNNYVAVDNYPIASFVPSSNSFTELTQLLEFTNTSSGANSYTWDFGDGGSSNEINPEYTFTANLNGHVITLTAYSQFLCSNIDSVEILFNNGLIYYIPNTFTPNGDEFNQTFKPIFSNSIDVYNYSFYIYNRWEHVIFETHDVEKGWDGLFGVDGTPVPQGTYTYKIIVKYTETDERKEFFGHINLVR